MNKNGGIETIIIGVILVGMIIALIVAAIIPTTTETQKLGNRGEVEIQKFGEVFDGKKVGIY